MDFGERLANSRKEKGFTQEEFAMRIGVTSQAVSKWERGQSMPDVVLLKSMCKALNMCADDLLGIEWERRIIESGGEKETARILGSVYAEPLLLEFGAGLVEVFERGLRTNLINDKRYETACRLGILIPVIHIRDVVRLADKEYRIVSYGREMSGGEADPADGDCYENIISELFELCIKNYGKIINKQIVKTLADSLRTQFPAVVDGLIPERISYLQLKHILCEKYDSEGNIRNLIGIIEEAEERLEAGF